MQRAPGKFGRLTCFELAQNQQDQSAPETLEISGGISNNLGKFSQYSTRSMPLAPIDSR
jgi:hypothetical protein